MREEESAKRIARMLARRRLQSDPAARANLARVVAVLRKIIGEPPDEPDWAVLAAAAQIAADLEEK